MTAQDSVPSPANSPEFLIHFAQIHEAFRQPEIDALALSHNIPLEWKFYSADSPFARITVPSEAAAKRLIASSILAKGIYTLLGHSTTYSTLHSYLRSNAHLIPTSVQTSSFKFTVESYLHKRSKRSQRDLINTFSYLPLSGPISLDNPTTKFTVFEEFAEKSQNGGETATPETETPHSVALGIFLAASSREIVAKYDLKKRNYIGTTSMDAELSLVTANCALASPGKILYDPFSGTGSFLVAASHFGAVTIGSDIDGRQIRGKKPGKSVKANFAQYDISGNYLDGFVADLTNTPLTKSRRFLDGIISDPPYGVREGLKVLGHRDPTKNGGEPVVKDGVLRFKEPDYVPPKKPYSFMKMLDDILDFAAETLVDGGRLAFWVPAANEEGLSLKVPKNKALELVALCPQEFNKWTRWLLVYQRKVGEVEGFEGLEKEEGGADEWEKMEAEREGRTADELNDFRKKYFKGFKEEVKNDGVGIEMRSVTEAFSASLKAMEENPDEYPPLGSPVKSDGVGIHVGSVAEALAASMKAMEENPDEFPPLGGGVKKDGVGIEMGSVAEALAASLKAMEANPDEYPPLGS